MSLLRPISIFLRNFLIKQHPYFSCCASCGEIKTPLSGRLCTSLLPDFPVDAVIIPAEGSALSLEEAALTLHSLKTHAPWLRRIHLLAAELPGDLTDEKLYLLPPASIVPQNATMPPQGYLHMAADLAEYYLVITAGKQVEHESLAVDYFTPNGIPLLFLHEAGTNQAEHTASHTPALDNALTAAGLSIETGLQPMRCAISASCKENDAAFLAFAGALPLPDAEPYHHALAHWGYAAGRVVPSAALRHSS